MSQTTRLYLYGVAELMNKDAANKLLKLIEEPPQKTLFLLTTNIKIVLLKQCFQDYKLQKFQILKKTTF